MSRKAVFNWSGGKDSALALQKVMQSGEYEIVSLLTTVNSETYRSSMHAIPVTLLEQQAQSIGLPLYVVELEPSGEMVGYETAMQRAVNHFKSMGVTHFIFGDIFLDDVRSYREKQLGPYGIEVVEPLWGKSSSEVIEEFLESGLSTIVVTTMAQILDDSYIGRKIDRKFIEDLPSEVDVCGENGEYHTFCYDGEIFKDPVRFETTEPFMFSHEVGTEDGAVRTFSYWYTKLNNIAKL